MSQNSDALLQAQDLSVAFDGFVAVDRVSLSLPQGSLIGIAGTNGAGKSTLFATLAGQVGVTQGQVHFAGQDITTWRPHRRARWGLARTFQVPREFA